MNANNLFLKKNALQQFFQTTQYVNKIERYHLAVRLRLTERQVKLWFQNRRSKMYEIFSPKRWQIRKGVAFSRHQNCGRSSQKCGINAA